MSTQNPSAATDVSQKASQSSRLGTRYSRGEATRERILTVAWGAFAERGFRGASVNDIAKNAGVTMPGLLHHFPTKSDLFSAVLDAREAQDTSRWMAMLSEEPTAFEVLDAFVAMARINADRYQFVQLTHLNSAESAPGDHPGSEFVKRHYRFTRDVLHDAFARGMDAGEIRKDIDPTVFALRVVAMIEGLENQWLHDRDGFDLASVFEGWVAELKRSLVP